MLNKILMPSGGQTVDEMTILKWNKQVGDLIKRGDILFEIETDKAILTVESFAEGTLLDIKYAEGELVKVGEVVALIGDEKDKESEMASPKQEQQKPELSERPMTGESATAMAVTAPPVKKGDEKKILASPLARSFARVEKIDLREVAQFISGKLIKKADIDNYLQQQKKSKLNGRDERDHYFLDTLSIRKTIARRMKESVSTAPHYVISVDVDMTAAIKLRTKLNESKSANGLKISFNDIFMKVIAKAIETSPLINSSFQEDRIKVYKDVNIGLAVATETGIIVPVVPGVNKKSIAEIAVANKSNIEKVKSNQVMEADMQGGTITISNLGMFGINCFTAIINQPESCILAIGAIIKKPIAVDNTVMIREMMNITGSFDHRIIDGAVGAPFLQKTKELLEDPELLLY